MKAFILISLNGKHEREMLDELRSFPEVKDAYVLFGEWDLIAEVEVSNPDALGTFVMDNIRSNPKVNLTSSLIVASR